jgi:hypothetical protein
MLRETDYGPASANRIGAAEYGTSSSSQAQQIEVAICWDKNKPHDVTVTESLLLPQASDLSLGLPDGFGTVSASLGCLGDPSFTNGFSGIPNFNARYVQPFESGILGYFSVTLPSPRSTARSTLPAASSFPKKLFGPSVTPGAPKPSVVGCFPPPITPEPTPQSSIQANIAAGFPCIVRHSDKASYTTLSYYWLDAVKFLSFDKRALAVPLLVPVKSGWYQRPTRFALLFAGEIDSLGGPGTVDHDPNTGFPILDVSNPEGSELYVEWQDRGAGEWKAVIVAVLLLAAGVPVTLLLARVQWRNPIYLGDDSGAN